MSRINADVIDVLENRQTRVEILSIDNKNPDAYVKSCLKPELISTATYRNVEGVDNLRFNLSDENYQKVLNSNLLIITMNNSFVLTPLSQAGKSLSCGSFAYDSEGNTALARLRIELKHLPNRWAISVFFDDNFKNIMNIAPDGYLFVL